ncbi:MAG: helix-turn-helix transcriptional regulator, partial [Oricola sp.]
VPAELISAIDDRSPIGDYLALDPAFAAVRALIHARNREYQKAWSGLSALVDTIVVDGEELHLMLLGSRFLRALANIPQPGPVAELARSKLIELATRLKTEGDIIGVTRWNGLEGLTQREFQILQCLADGDSNKAIALKYELSSHTVKRHVANILEKLQCASRGMAAARYRTHLQTKG